MNERLATRAEVIRELADVQPEEMREEWLRLWEEGQLAATVQANGKIAWVLMTKTDDEKKH